MDHTEVGLRAAIRALSDVVAPAVDPGHAQAGDQLRLTITYLDFVVQRLDWLHQRDRFELHHHLEMARAVQSAQGGSAGPLLAEAIPSGQAVLERAGVDPALVRRSTADLAAAVSATVRTAGTFDAPVRREIERSVLRISARRIAFERAWYQPLGLDPDPHDVRPLAEFLPVR